jgi:uracil-DNA glycosylase family 4
MATVGKNNSKSDDPELEKTYYYHLWKQRLGWTRHIVPVRAYHAKTGFFVEAYASIVSAINNIETQVVELKLACLPIEINDTIYASIKDIYPTARDLSLIKDDSLLFLPKSDKFIPKLVINPNKLVFLFKAYKGCSFTLKELEVMLNNKLTTKDTNQLIINGTKHCSIEAKMAQAYNGVANSKVYLVDSSTEKTQDTLGGLYEAYKACTRCELGVKRNERNSSLQATTGRLGDKLWPDISSDSTVDVMIIGEAPGLIEEQTQITFSASSCSGDTLKKVLDVAGFDQNKVYYTNAVLCRPESADKKHQNGKPTEENLISCSTRLKNEIAIVKPKIVLLLGKIAYKSFFGKDPLNVLSSCGWQNEDKTIYYAPHPSFVNRELSFAETDKVNKIKKDYLSHFQAIMQVLKN